MDDGKGKDPNPTKKKTVSIAAETPPDTTNYPKLRRDEEDRKLCKEIVKVLGGDGPQRVLLAGEAGIGKTRLAKMVGKYAMDHGVCFLTICLHLNQKFEDKQSLYENLASQLSVYSDFEETEVDDRDEDEEEEKMRDVLEDLKKKIADEIKKREEAFRENAENAEKAAVKKRKLLEDAAKKKTEDDGCKKNTKNWFGLGDRKPKDLLENKTGENQPAAGEEDPNTGMPAKGQKKDTYLLLILDDEGNITSEDMVMQALELEKFLKEQCLSEDDKRLKLIVTKGVPKKPGEESESHDNKSEQGSAGDAKNDEPDGITEEKPEPQSTGKPQVTVHDGKGVPPTGDESKVATKPYEKIKFSTTDLSGVLLDWINETNLEELFRSLTPIIDWKDDGDLISKIRKKSKKSPAAIFVLAKSLNEITRSITNKELKPKILSAVQSHPGINKELKQKMEELLSADRSNPGRNQELKQKIEAVLSADRSDPERNKELKQKIEEVFSDKDLKQKIEEVLSADWSERSDPYNEVLHLAYELLDTYGPSKNGAIVDCFWHSLDFFEHCGCVYYRDLITQWILEGYFDPVRSVEKAYQDGHSILMELINRGMLKIQENNVVVPEMAMSNLIDRRRRGHLGRSRLAFSRVYAGDKKKGIGKITQIDDMIKTVQAKKGDKITTILVSGDRLRRVTTNKYFARLGDLEVLGLFQPTLDPFIPDLNKQKGLRVLVIRDCDFLDNIKALKVLRELNALEVSGASSLKEIPDEFFKTLTKLQSLHLSGLQITSSPSSISDLKELHCLIIRDCPLLESLPDIQELVKLEVVDISGARGLQTCFDNSEKKNKSKNKNFYHLSKLKHLDFSESQIERLPIFQDSAEAKKLHSVTRLLLRDCSKLRRLPSLKPLSGLQILDLSGTTSLVEMLEVCFEDKKELKTLNLSRTNLSELATTIEELSGLNELLLKEATNLETIPDIQKLTNLEIIDVSGSSKLQKIEGSFEKMHYLREVNLSGTQVKILPELPERSRILCKKRLTLADGKTLEADTWEEVKKILPPSMTSEEASSSNAVVKPQVAENQPNVPHTNDGTEKGDVSTERFLRVPKDKALYTKAHPLFNPARPQEVMEISETSELNEEALAIAEFVSFVDITSTRLISIFNKINSLKGCWLAMCMDIKDLFSGVAEERLESLETLSITSLPSLKTVSFGGSFKNLKNLSIDCCPKIKTLFTEASQIPSSLRVLHIKHCEMLEKIVEGDDVLALTELKVEKCPNFKGSSEYSGYVMVDPLEAST